MNSMVVLVACIAAASANYAGYPYPGSYYGSGHGWGSYGGYYGGYHGPQAAPGTVLSSGYLADTPEVNAARNDHLTAVAESYYRLPKVLPSGFLADTPEVAAAKDAHLTAVAGQGGAAHYGHAYGYPYPH